MAEASFWENPGQNGDDAPVIRHAPNSNEYLVPDYDQVGKMRGSKVGRFALIPAANSNGTSKGFDASVAGPVHVDPDAPDGGVIFDASEVRSSDINRAVNSSQYPHQAFYQLGTPAAMLGIGKKKRAGYDQQQQGGFDVDAGRNPVMPNTYVVPHSAVTGRQAELPQQASFTAYNAQEEHLSLPSLGSLPPLPSATPAPYPQQQPVQAPPNQPQPQQYAPPQQYAAPQPAYYGPPAYAAPPPMDPNLQAMMQGMVGLQQTVAALAAQFNARQNQPNLPQTTGISPNPMPTRPAPQLRTQPQEQRNTRQASQQDEEFEETARPIRKQVKRNKDTQDIVEESEAEEAPRSLLRQQPREDGKRQTVREYAEQGQEQDGVIIGFESLKLKFVDGPIAHKARVKVIFEIPNAGRQMASFHAVIESAECVVLVYDTRFEDGQQYDPPDMDETPISLHVPSLKKTFQVSSMGLTYPFGVFDHIVLVKHKEEQLDYEEGK